MIFLPDPKKQDKKEKTTHKHFNNTKEQPIKIVSIEKKQNT